LWVPEILAREFRKFWHVLLQPARPRLSSGDGCAPRAHRDDKTSTLEDAIQEGHETEIRQAILDGAQQIAVPALVSTLCICIVFMPLFLLSGVARYLFVPLAEAVVFAMLASYILSRTLVPTLVMYMLKLNEGRGESQNLFVRLQKRFEKGFERLRNSYRGFLTRCVETRRVFIPAFLGICLFAFLLVPWLGQDFFPQSDAGQFILHIRAKTGSRMQTNEVQNAAVHYRWSASGTLTEVERVPTGGAGSGVLSPIYHISRPNDFEGAGSVILTPDRRFLFTTNAGDNSVSSFAVSEDGELTLVDTKRTGKNRLPLPPSGCAGFVGAQIAGTLGLKVEIRSVPCRVFHI